MSKDDAASLAQRMAALYTGLPRAHGTYKLLGRPTGGAKWVGKAATVREPVTDALWASHLAGTQGLGIVPIMDDATCHFAAIDIDKYTVDIKEVEASCARLRLPLVPCRTKSGGMHLYLFFAPPAPAARVRAKLGEWSVALGYGGSEIFPKQDALASIADVGNWINMPYFGAAKGETDRYAVFNGAPLSLGDFLNRANQLRITADQLDAIKVDIDASGDFEQGPPCLQSLARAGFAPGARNNGLYAIAVYLRKRFPDDWAGRLGYYNSKYMKPPLADVEVKTITKSLTRKKYNYRCEDYPVKSYCNRTLCTGREYGVGKGVDDWGVVIDSEALKIATDPPFWLLTVNGVRIKMFGEDFMQQRRFQQLCLERVGFMPNLLANDKWREQVNQVLRNSQEVAAPDDASVGGELAYLLKQFCTVYAQAETREEILTGKPYTEEGETYFRAADFKKFLDLQHFRGLAGPKLYAELRGLGLQHKQFWVADQNLTVWVVKAYTSPAAAAVPAHKVTDEGGM